MARLSLVTIAIREPLGGEENPCLVQASASTARRGFLVVGPRSSAGWPNGQVQRRLRPVNVVGGELYRRSRRLEAVVRPLPRTRPQNETHRPQRRAVGLAAATTRRHRQVTPAATAQTAPADPWRNHETDLENRQRVCHGVAHNFLPPTRWHNHGLSAGWPNGRLQLRLRLANRSRPLT